MVREIIAVQVGQCGNQIVTEFGKTMTKGHKAGDDSNLLVIKSKIQLE